MPRKRIHELAKELGLETRQLIAKLKLVGVKGKKAQSTLTDDEFALVRAGDAPQPTPDLVLGEEKLVAERVVTEVDQNEHLVTSREEVRENRIKPNVIRRRTKRVEVHEEAAPPAEPVFTAPSLDESFAPPPPIAFDLPNPVPTLPQQPVVFPPVSQEPTEPPAPATPPADGLEALSTNISEADTPGVPEPVSAEPPVDVSAPDGPEAVRTTEPPQADTPDAGLAVEARESTQPEISPSAPDQPDQPEPAESADQAHVAELAAHPPTDEPLAVEPTPSAQPATPPEAVVPAETGQAAGLRSARVLGRIDLGKLQEAKPSRPELKVTAPSSAPQPVAFRGPLQNGGEVPPTGLPKKGKKRKVIRKSELQETPERDIRMPRGLAKKRRVQPGKEQHQTEITVPRASKRVIRISEVITVGDLAKQMGIKAGEVIKKLMSLGLMATINQVLDMDTAALVAGEFEYTIENVAFNVDSVLEDSHEPVEDEGQLEVRPPVVTIMGHVDHGKTSLLDTIRQTNVTAHEHGGITQHIGAYSVEVDGRSLTFLDTPGHEAFTAMRARGAEVTDIVTIIVAADDGVMPQTVEAINHARAADVPIIVAINKIDKPSADTDRVKRELMNHGLLSEDLGGDIIVAPVSALTGEGIPELLEMILLQADIMELRSHPDKLARGVIVEAKLDRGRGPVATVLVQEGELKVGDPFVCGIQHGRIRAMLDSWGHKVEKASSSMPVEILGLTGVPEAGDFFVVLNDEAKARQVTEHRRSKRRETELAKNTTRTSLEDFHQQVQSSEVKDIRVIIKGDVQGSIEAVSDALNRLSTDEVKVSILHASPGGITESDVLLATASRGVIIGFNVRAESKAAHMAEREGIEIRFYNVIYELIEDIRAALEGLLEPIYEEKLLGQAEVRQVFSISRLGMIAGCFINEGRVQRGAQARLLREQKVVYEGKIATLKRFKDDVREVPAGTECGVGLESCKDIQPGDALEIYELEQVLRRLEPKPRPEVQARV
jgi:translation initiation factor IF-2